MDDIGLKLIQLFIEGSEGLQGVVKSDIFKLDLGQITLFDDKSESDNKLIDYFFNDPNDFLKSFKEVCLMHYNLKFQNINVLPYPEMSITRFANIAFESNNKPIRVKCYPMSVTPDIIETEFTHKCKNNNPKEPCLRTLIFKVKRQTCPACKVYYYSTEDITETSKVRREALLEEIEYADKKNISRQMIAHVNIPHNIQANIMGDEYFMGQKCDLVCILRHKIVKRDKNNQAQRNYYLEVIGIQFIENEMYSPLVIERAWKWLEEHKGNRIESIADHVFSGVYGLPHVRRAMIITCIGLLNDRKLLNGNSSQLVIVIIGDPGTVKSTMARQIEKFFRKVTTSTSVSSVAGLIGGLIKLSDGSFHFINGKLVMADGGIFIIDEANQIGEQVMEKLQEPMIREIIQSDKIQKKCIPVFCRYVILANPPNKEFDLYKPLVKQHNLGTAILDRATFLIFLTQNIPLSQIDELGRYVTGETSNKKDCDDVTMRCVLDIIEDFPNPKKITLEAHTKAREYFKKIKGFEIEMKKVQADSMRNFSARFLTNIEKAGAVQARVEQQEEVTPDNIDYGYAVVYESSVKPIQGEFNSIEYTDIVPAEKDENKLPKSMREILYWLIDQIKESKEGIDAIQLIERAKPFATSTAIDEYLSRLCREGQIMENPTGIYKSL